jgi:hypothetical protein
LQSYRYQYADDVRPGTTSPVHLLRFAMATRYKVCRERGGIYRHKFVISQMIEKYGEDEALRLLEQAKIIHRNIN